MNSATANVVTASATKMFRQPVTRSANSSGVVAASAPRPPATMIQPAREPSRSGGYHAAIAFSGAIRHAHTPRPMTARANASAGSESA